MTEVSITPDDVKRLGIKLMGLQHMLTPTERSILWGALAVAADAITGNKTVPGNTDLVAVDEDIRTPRVTIDDFWRNTDYLDPDFPDMLARAFHPETQPGSAAPETGPLAGGSQGKIGGLVGWKIGA